MEWLKQGHGGEVTSVAFGSAEEPWLVLSGDAQGLCRLWDVRVKRSVRMLGTKGDRAVGHAVLGSRGDAFVGCGNGLSRFDLGSSRVILDVAAEKVADGAHTDEVAEVDVHPDGVHVLTASDDGHVRVFDFSQAGAEPTLCFDKKAHETMCSAVRFTSKEHWDHIASAGYDFVLNSWKRGVHTSETIGFSQDPRAVTQAGAQMINPPFANALSTSGNLDTIAVAFGDGTVGVSSANTPTRLDARFPAHQGASCDLALSQDGALMLTASNSKVLRLWSRVGETWTADPALQWSLDVPVKVNRVALSRDSQHAVVALTGLNDLLVVPVCP
mmetsp:Transcript_12411/g.22127  ORF Transcript_12411/g.22127 Transcript_12411/m.22127 type:complete len:328 (+) Transcript_12411:39-1022(+)